MLSWHGQCDILYHANTNNHDRRGTPGDEEYLCAVSFCSCSISKRIIDSMSLDTEWNSCESQDHDSQISWILIFYRALLCCSITVRPSTPRDRRPIDRCTKMKGRHDVAHYAEPQESGGPIEQQRLFAAQIPSLRSAAAAAAVVNDDIPIVHHEPTSFHCAPCSSERDGRKSADISTTRLHRWISYSRPRRRNRNTRHTRTYHLYKSWVCGGVGDAATTCRPGFAFLSRCADGLIHRMYYMLVYYTVGAIGRPTKVRRSVSRCSGLRVSLA